MRIGETKLGRFPSFAMSSAFDGSYNSPSTIIAKYGYPNDTVVKVFGAAEHDRCPYHGTVGCEKNCMFVAKRSEADIVADTVHGGGFHSRFGGMTSAERQKVKRAIFIDEPIEGGLVKDADIIISQSPLTHV